MEDNLFMTPEQLLTRMTLKECDVCFGKIVRVCDGTYKCERCGKEFLDDYGKVKEYLYTHGRSTMTEIARNTGVSKQAVRNFLRYCKMEILEPAQSYLRCEMCGTALKSGQICPTCSRLINKEKLSTQDKIRLMNVGDKPRGNSPRTTITGGTYSNMNRTEKKESIEQLRIRSQETDSKLVKDLYEKRKNEG